LLVRKVKAGVFIGMILTSIVGMFFGLVPVPHGIQDIVGSVPSIAPTFAQLQWEKLLHPTGEILIVVFTFLFVDFFDTAGTVMSVA
ncbi:hypothetical protein QVM07_26870, partial [Klebsiella pneumoniae]